MWTVIGQDKAVTFLQKSLEKDSLAHAYLLVGLPHVGKMTLAVNLAMAINCEAAERPCGKCASCLRIAAGKHADVQVIELSQIVDSARAKVKPKSASSRWTRYCTRSIWRRTKGNTRFSSSTVWNSCPSAPPTAC